MAKFKFVGDPNHGNDGPDKEFDHRGYKFTKGKETEVPDSDNEAIQYLTNSNHFERTDGPRHSAPGPKPDQRQEQPRNQEPRKEDPNNENPKGMDHPRSPAPGRP